MAMEEMTNAIVPKWQKDLGLGPNDPATLRLAHVEEIFKTLRFPPRLSLPPRELKAAAYQRSHPAESDARERSVHFKYGPDYFFGKYAGKPESIAQNAETILYHGMKGAETWEMLKSIAYVGTNNSIVVAHVRGDRDVNPSALARFGVKEEKLASDEALESLGIQYGTVNPFINSEVPVTHVFDRDLVGGEDYPGKDLVFTSSGDRGYFVGFNVRLYLEAINEGSASAFTFPISKKDGTTPERIAAQRPIIVLGGDSGIDTAESGKKILSSTTHELERNHAYHGDRSLPYMEVISDPLLAPSIDTSLYYEELREHVKSMVDEIVKSYTEGPRPIVTFNSMAMHGVAGDILRNIKEIEYIGPQEALKYIFSELDGEGVKITLTELLGLPTVYDENLTAFTDKILNPHSINANVQKDIQSFVRDCKVGRGDVDTFYNRIVRAALRQTTKGTIETIRGTNLAIILGASELESFVSTSNEVPEGFTIIKSSDPRVIAEEIENAPPGITRLIMMQPSQAMADMIARKAVRREV